MNDPRLAFAGLLIGVLVGMTGMGGGSLEPRVGFRKNLSRAISPAYSSPVMRGS